MVYCIGVSKLCLWFTVLCPEGCVCGLLCLSVKDVFMVYNVVCRRLCLLFTVLWCPEGCVCCLLCCGVRKVVFVVYCVVFSSVRQISICESLVSVSNWYSFFFKCLVRPEVTCAHDSMLKPKSSLLKEISRKVFCSKAILADFMCI